jgi:hypothetical protein
MLSFVIQWLLKRLHIWNVTFLRWADGRSVVHCAGDYDTADRHE